jgi:hypothetical protein
MRPLENLAGAVYGYDREQVRNADLNPVFQQINRETFRGELSGVNASQIVEVLG